MVEMWYKKRFMSKAENFWIVLDAKSNDGTVSVQKNENSSRIFLHKIHDFKLSMTSRKRRPFLLPTIRRVIFKNDVFGEFLVKFRKT